MEAINQRTRDWLTRQLGADFTLEKHTYSHQDEVYKIQTPQQNVYLKIALDLEAERNNIIKTAPYLQVPKVLSFCRLRDTDHMLLGEVPGKNLAELVGEWDKIAIVKEFARATKKFHELDVHLLFPDQAAPGLVVLHGDMSLPNILCTAPSQASYIDLGQMHVGSLDTDLADALWSLQRNMGSDYGQLFLNEYGNVTMTEKLTQALAYRHVSNT